MTDTVEAATSVLGVGRETAHEAIAPADGASVLCSLYCTHLECVNQPGSVSSRQVVLARSKLIGNLSTLKVLDHCLFYIRVLDTTQAGYSTLAR